MKIHTHKDIEEYRKAQIAANIDKFERAWVSDVEIGIISNWIASNLPKPEFIICHGARNGFEMLKFAYFLGRGIRLLGTDISPTANDMPDMIQWDFHEINPDWHGLVDIVYCNSLDHSYDIKKAVTSWLDSLKPTGVILIHWTPKHEYGEVSDSDCFHASWKEYSDLLNEVAIIEEWVTIHILKCGGFFVVGKKNIL